MGKKLRYYTLLVVSIFLGINCKNTPSDNNDTLSISEKIIGVWEGDFGTIEFSKDFTFVDSSYVYSYPDSELYKCSFDKNLSSESPIQLLDKVVTGTYSIIDTVISFASFELVSDCFPNPADRNSPYLPAQIKFNSDSLILNHFREYERITESDSGLSGTWRTNYSALVYHKSVGQNGSFLTLDEIKEFIPDSGIVRTWISLPFDTTYETMYFFDPPVYSPYPEARPVQQMLFVNEQSITLFEENAKMYKRNF